MRFGLLLSLLLCPLAARADETKPVNTAVPYRTDSANQDLPWYQLKTGEFPPHGSEHRVRGWLVAADFIRRRGQFREINSGELVDFTLPSFGSVYYTGAEADLRDVPLGTWCVFFLYQDAFGNFTRAASVRDYYSLLTSDGATLRLDEAKLDQGQLFVSTPTVVAGRTPAISGGDTDPEGRPLRVPLRLSLPVNDKTRVWKGDQQIKLADLAVGDELLVNLRDGKDTEDPCTDIWVGAETHKLATEAQRKRHLEFLKKRGLPAWVDRVEGKKVTVTLFGDPADTAALMKDEGIVPTQWAAEHRNIDAVVATPDLRTYNPPVDRQGSLVQQFDAVPTDCFGSSGIRFTIEPRLLIEGFRRGHIVRLFVHPSWKVEDMDWGEKAFDESAGFRNELEEPIQYPFRTDFANEELPWYQLKPGEFPPMNSHHLVSGELTKVDPVHRSGQFRNDRTAELVDFTLPPYGSVRYLNGEADLEELPLGSHCRFFLYQDQQGAFTCAAMILDDFTRMDQFTRMLGDKLSYRIEAIHLDEGKLLLADQLGLVENYKGDKVRPPDVGRGEFAVDDQTRVWKGDQQVKLTDLAVGDELLLSRTGVTPTSRGRCTDIWVGADTFKLVTDRQREKHNAVFEQRGLTGWIDRVEGNVLTISFFAGPGQEFQGLFHDGPPGGNVKLMPVDDALAPLGPADAMKFKSGWLADTAVGVYGFRGARWVVEAPGPPSSYHAGQIVRAFNAAWPNAPAGH